MLLGSIYCRFRQASPELKALGWLLVSASCLEGDFEPYFLLEEDKTRLPVRQIVLTQTALQVSIMMMEPCLFSRPMISGSYFY